MAGNNKRNQLIKPCMTYQLQFLFVASKPRVNLVILTQVNMENGSSINQSINQCFNSIAAYVLDWLQ